MNEVHPQVWLHNFTSSVAAMILEYQTQGYAVKAIQISPSIYNNIASIIGRDPDTLCGFIVEIIEDDQTLIKKLMAEDTDPEDITEEDLDGYVGLRADPIC